MRCKLSWGVPETVGHWGPSLVQIVTKWVRFQKGWSPATLLQFLQKMYPIFHFTGGKNVCKNLNACVAYNLLCAFYSGTSTQICTYTSIAGTQLREQITWVQIASAKGILSFWKYSLHSTQVITLRRSMDLKFLHTHIQISEINSKDFYKWDPK